MGHLGILHPVLHRSGEGSVFRALLELRGRSYLVFALT